MLGAWFVLPFAGGYLLAQLYNATKRPAAQGVNAVKTGMLLGGSGLAVALVMFIYWAYNVK